MVVWLYDIGCEGCKNRRPLLPRMIVRGGGIISPYTKGAGRSSMKARHLAGALIGAFITFLGLLWLLQGTGLLRIRPILCIANCEEIVGPSPVWAVSGLIALIIGVIVVFVSLSGIRRP